MSPRNRVLVFGLAALALCLGAVSCRKAPGFVRDAKLDAIVEAEVARISQGGRGHGFVCWGYPDGGVGCACNDDAPAGDIWSCDGMERVCDGLGTGQLCNPSTNWCYCAALKKI
jgi:hypothetical protein